MLKQAHKTARPAGIRILDACLRKENCFSTWLCTGGVIFNKHTSCIEVQPLDLGKVMKVWCIYLWSHYMEYYSGLNHRPAPMFFVRICVYLRFLNLTPAAHRPRSHSRSRIWFLVLFSLLNYVTFITQVCNFSGQKLSVVFTVKPYWTGRHDFVCTT